MKKSLILGLLGLAASVATSLGQGTIMLDNYNFGTASVTYGANVPANGVSGANGGAGSGVVAGWTMGLYYALGNVTGSVGADATGTADPATLGGGLLLGSGTGSTASFYTSTFSSPGKALASFGFPVPGTASAGGDTITVMVIAYDSADGSYANAKFRGHSSAFTMTTSLNTAQSPNAVGSAMSSFAVLPVPEPSIFALSGLGAAALMLIRRKK